MRRKIDVESVRKQIAKRIGMDPNCCGDKPQGGSSLFDEVQRSISEEDNPG